MKMIDLKRTALNVINNYSSFLTLEAVEDIFILPSSARVKLKDFIVSEGFYYCNLVKNVCDDGDIEIFCTLSWTTPCYDCSIVFSYDCKTQTISVFRGVLLLKNK